jgi:hypothetical protein
MLLKLSDESTRHYEVIIDLLDKIFIIPLNISGVKLSKAYLRKDVTKIFLKNQAYESRQKAELNSREFRTRYTNLSRHVIKTSEFYCYAYHISRDESAFQRRVYVYTQSHRLQGCAESILLIQHCRSISCLYAGYM